MSKRSWTDEKLTHVVAQSYSIAQILTKLGLRPAGGNYRQIREAINRLSLDTSHFTGQSWSAGKKLGTRQSIDTYLVEDRPVSSDRLRKRLIHEGIFKEGCSGCRLSEWLGGKIPLELDHIDGNNRNNMLANLRLLCPNCHALTPTYRGKNIGRGSLV